MVDIIFCCMVGFLLGLLEGREMGSLVVSFYGTGDDVGGNCVGLLVGGNMTAFDLDYMLLNGSSSLSCKA